MEQSPEAARQAMQHEASSTFTATRTDSMVAGMVAAALSVQFNGVYGQVYINQRGDFVFQADEVVPANELLGATLEPGGASFLVWYCQRMQSGGTGGKPAKVQYRLVKTGRFACDSSRAALDAVFQVRRSSSWWGRPTPPHVVVIMNPLSGQQKSASIVESTILPMLQDAAGMQVTVHTTQGPQHATQIVRGLDYNSVDAILFAGGDGTAHEGLQGLLGRPDWACCAAVPFAAIPTGSGNGLAASCGHWDAVTAVFSITRGRSVPLDVASVLQAPNCRYYIFLSLVFGLMSNLDIGTEDWRWMGELRFTLGGLREVLRNRPYPARVAFLRAKEAAEEQVVLDADVLAAAARVTCDETSQPVASTSEVQDTLSEHLLGSSSSPRRQSQWSKMAPQQPQQHAPLARNAAHGVFRVQAVPDGPPLSILASLPALPSCVPSCKEQLPHGWELLPTTALSYFGVYNTQWLALNGRLNPKGSLSSGSVDLICSPSPRTLWQRITVLLQADTGDYIHLPYVHSAKVRAIMFEPLCLDTWVVLDGEVAPCQTVFLEVHQGLCRVLVAPEFEDPSTVLLPVHQAQGVPIAQPVAVQPGMLTPA